MADAPPPKGKPAPKPKTDGDILGWIIGLVIVLSVVGGIMSTIQARFGALSPGAITARYRLSDDTPLGLTVRTMGETLVWSGAASGNLLGAHLSGVAGTLVAGPVRVEDVRWWQIDFEQDPDGWVAESDIALENRAISFGRTFRIVSGILSLFLLSGIIYALWRLLEIRKGEARTLKLSSESAFASDGDLKNLRWQSVTDLIASDNPNDWRAAIIEADVMLEELVTTMGYPGENLGDKMQAIEKSDFTTLDKAWEAHKVRNRIAHEGGDFLLTQREARRIIGLFEDVFKEFNII